MNKNNLPIYFSLAVILGIIIGIFFYGNPSNSVFSTESPQERKIKKLINFIQRDYVDNVNTDELLDGAITEMLQKLDPHSVYIPKENLQAVTESMQGNFIGIGVEFRMINDSITVVQPIKGGPSIKAGIKAGDRILMANNDTLYGRKMGASNVPKYLKGKPLTEVKLQIYRKTTDSLFTINLKRDKVNIKSVDLSYMINDSLGYIKIDRFARNTYSEFKTALNSLLKSGLKDLVLDLRGNGGGYIDIATRIIDEFLENKKLMVFTKNNKGFIENYYATSTGSFEKGLLYVLIDENSASASEIVAGALQDNDKGIIIGRRSFGKGLVQVEMDLGDGSAVRLTTARYYTPTGRSIQKPYGKDAAENYYDDFKNRIQNGELLTKDSIKVVDSLQYKTPNGKIVYGGGGIIPDVFVAIDTTGYLSGFYFNTLNNFAFDYVDSNRKKFEKLKLNDFITNFDGNNLILEDYLTSIKDRAKPSAKTKKIIEKYLHASVASSLFGDIGFYKIIHQDDKMLQKVLELETKKE